MNFLASVFLGFGLVVSLAAQAGIREEFPLTETAQTFRVSAASFGPARYSIQNELGNIRVYPVDGDELVFKVDGLRFATGGLLRVWSPGPGQVVVRVVYPSVTVIPPAGQISDTYKVSDPANGVVLKNGVVALAGRHFTSGSVLDLGATGLLTLEGIKGETHLAVGVPANVLALKAESSLGDVLVEGLGKFPGVNSQRVIFPDIYLGSARVLANAHSLGDRVYVKGRNFTESPSNERVIFGSSRASEPAAVQTSGACVSAVERQSLEGQFEFDSAEW